MADIFVSYAHEDEARVQALVSEFQAQGWSVFWDRHIPAGSTWRSHIGAALDEARCIVVLWSQHSVRSDWVSEEADEGKRRRILIPVIVEGVQPPRGFREVQAADLTDWQPGMPSDRFKRLCLDMSELLRDPTPGQRGGSPSTAGTATAAPPTTDTPRAVPARIAGAETQAPRPPRAMFALGALAALVLVGGVVYYSMSPRQSDEPERATPPAQGASPAPEPVAVPPKVEIPPKVETPRPTARTPQWLVVAGTYRPTEASAVQRRRQALVDAGLDALAIDTNDYPLLAPGLVAVVVGPFASRMEANTALAAVRGSIRDAYVKQGR